LAWVSIPVAWSQVKGPAQPEQHAQQRRAGQPGRRAQRRLQHPAREREPVEDPGEQQAQQNHQGAQHLDQDLLVGQQDPAQAAERRAVAGE
jgi:hypothetical protein